MTATLKAKVLGTAFVIALLIIAAILALFEMGFRVSPAWALTGFVPLSIAVLVCIWAPETKDKP